MAWVKGKIGKSPVVLPSGDTLGGLVGLYLKFTVVLILFHLTIYSSFPEFYTNLAPLVCLENDYLKLFGLFLMTISFLIILIAQTTMQASWRIGIDESQKTKLVETGIFKLSRNPIYLGIILLLFGYFFISPDEITLLIAVLGYTLSHFQIRLEEEFLEKIHGEDYLGYKRRVRRLI